MSRSYRNHLNKYATTNAEARGEYGAVIERLDTAERLIILENDGRADTDEASALLAKLLEDVPTEGKNTIDAEAYTQGHTYDTYTTTSQTRFNCHTQGTDFGKVTGSVTGYVGWSYLVSTSAYPAYISDGTVGQCENTSFSRTTVTYNLVTDPESVCIHYITSSPTGTVGGTCDEFGIGSLILIVANATYDDTVFKLPNAFTFVLV